MPPSKKSRTRGHDWTKFELHAMLCLLARGVHLENPAERDVNPYERFATMLNEICSGKYGFNEDIDRREITGMLDQLLMERTHVVGRNGLLDRGLGGRVTRGLKRAWERGDYGDKYLAFTGSQAEWAAGRREKVMKAYKIERGLLLADDVDVNMEIDDEDEAPATPLDAPRSSSTSSNVKKPSLSRTPKTNAKSTSSDSTYLSRQLQGFEYAAKSSKSRGKQKGSAALSEAVVDKNDDDMDTDIDFIPARQEIEEDTNKLDSFATLPDKLKKSGRFDWAIPGSPRPNLFANEVSVELKGPGMNTRRSDVKALPNGRRGVEDQANTAVGRVESSVVEKDMGGEEEAKKRKRPGLNASRTDTERPGVSISNSYNPNTTPPKNMDTDNPYSDSGFDGSSPLTPPRAGISNRTQLSVGAQGSTGRGGDEHEDEDDEEEMEFAEEEEVADDDNEDEV